MRVQLQPLFNLNDIVVEREFIDIQLKLLAHDRQIVSEQPVARDDEHATRDFDGRRCGVTQPIADYFDRFGGIRAVSVNVLASNVRNELLEAIPLHIEDETRLLPLLSTPESFGTQKDAEFKWHVEARKTGCSIWLRSTNIVNTKLARADDLCDLLDPNFACIVDFACTSSDVAAVMNGEDESFEER